MAVRSRTQDGNNEPTTDEQTRITVTEETLRRIIREEIHADNEAVADLIVERVHQIVESVTGVKAK